MTILGAIGIGTASLLLAGIGAYWLRLSFEVVRETGA